MAQHDVRFTDPPTVIMPNPPILHNPFRPKIDFEKESFNEEGSVAESLESADIDRIQNQSKEKHAKQASRLNEIVPSPNTFFLPDPPKEPSIVGDYTVNPAAEGVYGEFNVTLTLTS